MAAYHSYLSAIQPWIAVLSTYATISLISSKIHVVFTLNGIIEILFQRNRLGDYRLKICPGAKFKHFHAVRCTLNPVRMLLSVVTIPRSPLVPMY